ncbi:MAG: DUF805 domain-containing protein [Chloroflexota bacterium]
MEWYLKVLQQYFDFSGRARRKEYWYFVLVNFGISIVLGIIDFTLFNAAESGFSPLSSLYSLAVLIPSVAVGIRRLHDTGRSGWWLLIGLIPLIGAIVLLIFFFQDSEAGTNKWGPNPKMKLAGA